MITGTPSSTNGTDLYLPSELPESILRLIFFVDLIIICHLQSLLRDPFVYSRVERFLCFVRAKHEHFMHVLDSSVGFYPDKAAYAFIVSYKSLRSDHVDPSQNNS